MHFIAQNFVWFFISSVFSFTLMIISLFLAKNVKNENISLLFFVLTFLSMFVLIICQWVGIGGFFANLAGK